MRILILGAGAMGSLFGGHLARNHDVTLVCRKPHADAITRSGLSVTGLSDILVRPKAVTSVAGLEPPEILFLTVKAYDTGAALEGMKRAVSPGTVLVSLQNGLGNLETIQAAFPESDVVPALTGHAAILRSPGLVEHTGRSYTAVGGPEAAAGRVAAILNGAGLETAVTGDIQSEIWYKAIVNSAINPIAALTGERNGIILEERFAGLVARIAREGTDVAHAKGLGLDGKEAVARVMKVAADTSNNMCSMLIDLRNGRRTEIMQMNGAIASYGAEAGVPAPANSLLTALVLARERA